MFVRGTAIAFAVAALFAATALPGIAQTPSKMEKMDHKMDHGKMDKMSKPVYVVKETRMAYSAEQAKTMKMMDAKGHKLVKMDKMPAGYKMAPAQMDKVEHKMDKMGSKMSGKIEKKPATKI
jgi:hypothetical protein